MNYKQTWQQSLNKSSENLIDLLISQHESDLKTIKEQLETSKTQLNTRNDISNELQLVDNWLTNDNKAFFNFLNKKKQDKFTNHLLTATRSESNVNDPANKKVNSPINPKLHTNLNTNETETNTDQTATFTPQNPTIHLITQPNLARTNKKKKRRYHKGRTRKSNCVYTDLVVNLSNYQLTEEEIKVLAKGLKFIPSPRNINKTEVLADGCDSRNTFMI